VEESLTKDKNIAFNAGSHYELLQVAYADFERLVMPRVVSFAGLQASLPQVPGSRYSRTPRCMTVRPPKNAFNLV